MITAGGGRAQIDALRPRLNCRSTNSLRGMQH